ncbi:hypothetical protein N4P33_34430, partial [Streptomyces sp. 15-116A]|nr:hypothetical protein [Streptomyces sp. 15-116A]
MTDTGQVPGEGLPENAGMVEHQGVAAPGAYTYLSATSAEDEEDLLLPGAQGAWGNEVPPPAPEPLVETVHAPGPHELSGRDSGAIDLGPTRSPHSASHTTPEDQPTAYEEQPVRYEEQPAGFEGQPVPQDVQGAHEGMAQHEGLAPQGQPVEYAVPVPQEGMAPVGQPVPGEMDAVDAGSVAQEGLNSAEQTTPGDAAAMQVQAAAHPEWAPQEALASGEQAAFPAEVAASRTAATSSAGAPDAMQAHAQPYQQEGESSAEQTAPTDGAAVQVQAAVDAGSLQQESSAPQAQEGAAVQHSAAHAGAERPAPVTPRRPLHLGPPIPNPSAGPVRSLADRGPAHAPVRQSGPPTIGPEYLDVPQAPEAAPQPAAPWGAQATVTSGEPAAETVVPTQEPEPADAAHAAVDRLTAQAPTEQAHTEDRSAEPARPQDAGQPASGVPEHAVADVDRGTENASDVSGDSPADPATAAPADAEQVRVGDSAPGADEETSAAVATDAPAPVAAEAGDAVVTLSEDAAVTAATLSEDAAVTAAAPDDIQNPVSPEATAAEPTPTEGDAVQPEATPTAAEPAVAEAPVSATPEDAEGTAPLPAPEPTTPEADQAHAEPPVQGPQQTPVTPLDTPAPGVPATRTPDGGLGVRL